MYRRHRFPPEIIQHTVWLYHRFNLSARDIEDLMAERGIAISYESIRLWCIKFGPRYAKRLRRRHQGYGDTFFIVANPDRSLQISCGATESLIAMSPLMRFTATVSTRTITRGSRINQRGSESAA